MIVAFRTDRGMLVSLYNPTNQSQCCQVQIATLDCKELEASLQTDDEYDTQKEAAIRLIKEVAERFASNKVDRDSLFLERDKVMVEWGLTFKSKRKRVAAAVTVAPEVDEAKVQKKSSKAKTKKKLKKASLIAPETLAGLVSAPLETVEVAIEINRQLHRNLSEESMPSMPSMSLLEEAEWYNDTLQSM